MGIARGGRTRPAPPRGEGARRRGGHLAAAARDGWQWLYGRHAALAAAANPRRRVARLVALADLAPALQAAGAAAGVPRPVVEVVERTALAPLLPPGAVHQGLAVLAAPLAAPPLEALLAACGTDAVVVVLDQAVDPRNVGAVLRAAAAFAAAAVIVQDRHAPPTAGALAKAASGALERVPLVTVVNIARAVRTLGAAGFTCLGLDAAATRPLERTALSGRLALVLGGEGGGLRRLVREACDALVRIPMAPATDSLNLAVAAGIALYEAAAARRRAAEVTP